MQKKQSDEFGFRPHPRLAVPDWDKNMRDKTQMKPMVAAMKHLAIHGLRKVVKDDRGEDTGKRDFLGFAIWDSEAGSWFKGSEDEPIKDYETAEKLLAKIFTPDPVKPVDILS